MPQIPGPAKLGQAKQFQKHQQQQTSRVSKGVSHGPMMMQGLSQSNNLPANVNIGSKEMPGELPGQTGGHPLQQGQRVLQPQGQIQSGKLQAWSQQGIAGQKPQLQGGAQSQGLAYIAGQQKGHQQQQGVQVLASKQQQSQQQAASLQQQTQRTPSPQQAQPQQQLPLSAQITQPQLQPPTPCQQQQQQSQQNQRWPMQQQQEPPHQRRSVSLKLPK
jgi:hypothetical protein